jgi:hypothetical protein
MQTKLICYSLKKITPSERTKLHRELYGYKDISNRGKYNYRRKGLANKIKCKKITNSVILTNGDYSREVVRLLKKYMAKIYVFDVLGKSGV